MTVDFSSDIVDFIVKKSSNNPRKISDTIDKTIKSTDLKAYEILMLEEQVESIKNHLSESEYNCIMARYFGASYKETAQTFGYTVKQVDNKIQSVRKDKTRFIKQTSI